ncbi:MAG: hypothetical protein JXJ17_03690 [Anaerolineae bacterium]|nr:hypothetical protein [Anaerolineae bacterium]
MKLVFWQGFDHYWQKESHRLNRFGSHVSSDESNSGLHLTFTSSMLIGRFPHDIAHIYSLVDLIDVPTGQQIEGEATFEVEGKLGKLAEVRGEKIEVTLPGNLTGAPVLRGFDIEALNYPHGFHTRGFGFLLDDIELTAGSDQTVVSFVPKIFMHPAKSPDPFTDPDRFVWRVMPFPRNIEPHTPSEFKYRMTLYYAVIAADNDQVKITIPAGERQVKLEHYARRRSPRAAAYNLQGAGGGEYPMAALGIRGFRWELRDWERTVHNGRYLRKLGCLIDGLSYGPDSGEMSYNARMDFSNGRRRQDSEPRFIWGRVVRVYRRFSNIEKEAKRRTYRTSYGFHAVHTLYPVLFQFRKAVDPVYPVARLYNRIDKAVTVQSEIILPK